LLKEAKTFIEEGLPSQRIIKGYRFALTQALEHLERLSEKIDVDDKE
jgi:chaperonin GroEL (HSP60 family)